MAWDYDYQADAVALSDHCSNIRVVTEYGLASFTDADFVLPGGHGTQYGGNELMGAGNAILITRLLDSEPDGTVSHVDGRAGHINENLSALKTIFNKRTSLVSLTRTAPDFGDQVLECVLMDTPQSGQDRLEIVWTLKCPKPLWRAATVTTTNPITTGAFDPGGNAPVDDMVLTFTGAGSVESEFGDKVEVTATCIVDVGARTVKVGSTPTPGLILPANERWLHLDGGRSTTLTVTGTVAMDHYAKSS